MALIRNINFLLSLLLILSASFTVYSQPAGKYRVCLTDKNNSPYSVSSPQDFLSARAITRRTTQGIPVSMQDIPVNPSYVQAVASTGVTIINKSKWFNSLVVEILNTAQYNQVNALSFVDTLIFLAPQTIKSGSTDKFDLELIPKVPQSTPLKSTQSVIDYGLADNQVTMISLDALHDQGYTGQGMVIAVIDAGFIGANTSAVFDSLWQSNRVLGYRDFAEPGGDIFNAHTHGTMVLSIIAANIPGQMVGTAPHASYWLLRSEIGSSEYLVEEDNWVAAAEFADSAGVDVINSSLGYTEFYDLSMNHTYEEMDGNTTRVTRGADIAASKGMMVVNSAGNSGASSWNYIGAPADGDSVFAIGAVDAWGTYASFSSNGPTYDGRVKPDISAQGQGTTYGDPWGGISSGNGTSFSSPVIAGAVACLWQANPGYTNVQLMDAIRHSASLYSNPDTLLGYGIPDFASASVILGGPEISKPSSAPNLQVTRAGEGVIEMRVSGDIDYAVLTLTDMQGRLIEEYPVRSYLEGDLLQIETPRLPSGLYLIGLNTGSVITAVKVHYF